MQIPVITIDGPSGVGKGTLASQLASHLGWHFLDSGAIYRLLALAAIEAELDLSDENQLQQEAQNLKVQFQSVNYPPSAFGTSPLRPSPALRAPSPASEREESAGILRGGRDFGGASGHPEKGEGKLSGASILLNNKDVTEKIRNELCGQVASQIAAYPKVRAALLERQRAFQQPPGLVADGRDMGTVVFPQASLKFFLFASQEERAKRRYNQLKERGINVSLKELVQELAKRDQRDMSRSAAPLVPAPDAIIIDSTTLNKEAVFSRALKALEKMKL